MPTYSRNYIFLWNITASFGRPFFVAIPFKLVEFARGFADVLIISAFLAASENTNQDNTEWLQKGLFYALLMFLSGQCGLYLETQFDLKCEMVSINMKSALQSAVYDKVLRMSTGSKKEHDSGQVE